MASAGKATEAGRAWLYTTGAGGLEKHLKLGQAVLEPTKAQELRVEVFAASLNPIDYKLPEIPLIGPRITKLPASPCKDFAGRVVSIGSGSQTEFKRGDRVFGRLVRPVQHGSLAQYINVEVAGVARLPDGLSFEQGAAIAIAGSTALQVLAAVGSEEGAAKGKTVLINGASGGVGSFAVQLAKLFGAKVVAICSGANAQLVKDLGADEVIDYRATDARKELTKSERLGQFDLIVDNVGTSWLHKAGDICLKASGSVVQVGSALNLEAAINFAKSALLPVFLGGAKRPWKFLSVVNKREDYEKLAGWIAQGKIKVLVDSTFSFEDAPRAFERLKTGRARGKIIVSTSA